MMPDAAPRSSLKDGLTFMDMKARLPFSKQLPVERNRRPRCGLQSTAGIALQEE